MMSTRRRPLTTKPLDGNACPSGKTSHDVCRQTFVASGVRVSGGDVAAPMLALNAAIAQPPPATKTRRVIMSVLPDLEAREVYTTNTRWRSSSDGGSGRIAGVRAVQKLAVVAVVAVIALVAVAAYVMWWRAQTGSDPVETMEESRGVRENGPVVSAATPSAKSPAAPSEPLTSYAEQFDTARDLLPFANAMHERALAGDDAAQYWLYRVLERCGPIYDGIFVLDPAQPDEPPLRLDEAVADEEAEPGLGVDEIREVHAQCQQLRGIDRGRYGELEVWLRRAAESGYPLAQVRRAAELALGVGGAPNHAQASESMRAAVRSGDPEVMLQIGSVMQVLAGGESERERIEWVWEVAACHRGANCAPTSEWVRAVCAIDKKCQPYETAIDVIRRRAGAQMPEIEEAARHLNARIDAREWDELGL
jgi:hypothetical protein